MKSFWRSGDPFIWLTGSALAFCLLMIAGLVGVILTNSLGVFWPEELQQVRLRDGSQFLGQVVGRQEIPADLGAQTVKYRTQFKVGNRDVYGLDFRWVDDADIAAVEIVADAVVFERLEWGDMYGFIKRVYRQGDAEIAASDNWERLAQYLNESEAIWERIEVLEDDDIGALNVKMEQLRQQKNRAAKAGQAKTQLKVLEEKERQYWQDYDKLAKKLEQLRQENSAYQVEVALASGQTQHLSVAAIVRAYRPNDLGLGGKLAIYLAKAGEFIGGQPRESNTEGGIFPALFGTVMMVILMSLAAVPFGVLAALYLREYARQGALVQAIRIAVNNLAGVPSIVFGMFGLGFFVYGIGGTLDQLFYADSLPTPTFGTGGILWASLTLALLTVPVVVVSTEEALAAVPREMREGSLALGSTKFQTIWNIVLPGALPGILTGVILATARGAGEVAPLMITGVVKLAPDLPLDSYWPFFHLERKFMHLGFHIYDVGFQSPNVEAARPMVFTTALLLLVIVLLLNLTAMIVRNYLRRRYAGSAF